MKGFTFIEILIASAVIIIITIISLSVFLKFRSSAELNSYVEVGLSFLAEARSKTLSSEDFSNYGVHFESGKIVLFKGSSYLPDDPGNKETLLSSTTEIKCVSLNGGGADVIFKTRTGETDQYGTLILASKSDSLKSKIIAVLPAGNIIVPKTPDGLVAYWNFDESNGPTIYNTVGNNNNGTMVNLDPAADRTGGKICGAIEFNGTNGYVSVPSSNDLDITGDITISFWIRPSVDSINFHNGWNFFIYHESPLKYEAGFYNTEGPRFKPYNDSSASFELTSNDSLSAGSWYHILYKRSASLLEIYLNGELKAQRDDFSGQLSAGQDEIRIGGSGGLDGFMGAIDEVRIYNRALMLYEINQLYNVGI